MVYRPEDDGADIDAANGYRTIGDVLASPQLLRPVRTEADARAAVIRSRMLAGVNAMFAAGAVDREIAGELVAMIEGATS